MLALQGPAALALLAPLCEGIDPLSAVAVHVRRGARRRRAVHGRAHRLHGRAGRRADLPGQRGRGAVGRADRGRRRALRPRRARCPAARGLLPAARQRHHAGHQRDRGRPRLGLRARQAVHRLGRARAHARRRARRASSSRCAWTRSAPCRGPACPILDGGGRVVGEVTSGTFSPTLERGIGLGYVPSRAGRAGHARSPSTCAGARCMAHTARKPLYVKET